MKIRSFLFFYMWISTFYGHQVLNSPARDWLEKSYLPSLRGSVLYVGIGEYTQRYHLLTKTPKEFETIDFDESKACFGSPNGHYVENFALFQPNKLFDHVCLFGVMGHPSTTGTSIYSIVDEQTIEEAIQKAHLLLKVGGSLQLGPNHRDHPGQDSDFWLKQFSKPPLDEYKIIFSATYSDNVVWWGKKRVK